MFSPKRRLDVPFGAARRLTETPIFAPMLCQEGLPFNFFTTPDNLYLHQAMALEGFQGLTC
jgi:hypothetical protein